ncbi:MAG: energy-coupling factor ABC transporter ATP-binding protein [Chloroflexia bacterium]|nr:energy-coupling factor ABC transporter ATP-binding protein [Chloroflexia bacterium]
MTSPLAELDAVSYRYPNSRSDALRDESWTLKAGSFSLLVGPSGSGKSSLLRCLNGLVPHFSGGTFGGQVIINGLDTRCVGPRELSALVGFVFQDPEAQLVTDRVEDEIAFGLEQHGVDQTSMRKRVEESLDYLGIEHLRRRRPSELSGGERQRVAIAAALAMHPKLLVLDEPTSQLDPWGAEDVLSVLTRLNDDLGLTVVVAEHRLDRLLNRADTVRVMGGPGVVALTGSPEQVVPLMDTVPLPPVTQLGKALGETNPPLTVKAARAAFARIRMGTHPGPASTATSGEIVTALADVRVRLGGRTVLDKVSLEVRKGELVAVMGRNGSGKTTLLRAIAGLHPVDRGAVVTAGVDLRKDDPGALHGQVGYVPQQASTLFFHERLIDELRFTARVRGVAGDPHAILERFGLADRSDSHSLDLSGGERERAALATVMMGKPRLLLIDEPTRGMDAWRKADLAAHLMELQQDGVAIVMVTHDVELVATCASRVIMLGNSGIVADGTPREVLAGSLTYTTQINKVFGGTWLTVEDVMAGLAANADADFVGADQNRP